MMTHRKRLAKGKQMLGVAALVLGLTGVFAPYSAHAASNINQVPATISAHATAHNSAFPPPYYPFPHPYPYPFPHPYPPFPYPYPFPHPYPYPFPHPYPPFPHPYPPFPHPYEVHSNIR